MNDQMKRSGSAMLLVFCALLLVFGFAQYTAQAGSEPRPQVSAHVLAVPTPITTPSALDALNTTSNINAGGNLTVAGDADVTGNVAVGGDITVTGVITTNGGYIGITPVATATARPYWCGSQSVLGSATVIPATLTAAGITTPRAPVASLAADITLDANAVTVANASGVVTLKVWQLRVAATTTPQAATTAVAVNYCISGNQP